MITIKEVGITYVARCSLAVGFGPSPHDALDDLTISLNEFRRDATPREAVKARVLIREARAKARETRP